MNEYSFSKICRVCGDKALGFNFNGLSCESCKIFFRRNAFRREKLLCRRMTCSIDISTRKCCQRCRVEKCFRIGMKKEMIKSKYANHSKILIEEGQMCNTPEYTSTIIPNLQLVELERLLEVQQAMSIFLDETKMEIVGACESMMEVFNLGALYIRKIIKFCKSIKAFKDLKQEDQLIILKTFYGDFLTVRVSFMYNIEMDGYYIKKNEADGKVIFINMKVFRQWNKKNVESFFRRFVYSLQSEMENDSTIRDLVMAHLLFKPQENVSCQELLKYNQHVYNHLLKRHLEHKYQNSIKAEQKYASLMEVLDKLTEVTQLAKEIFMDFDAENMIGVLREIFK